MADNAQRNNHLAKARELLNVVPDVDATHEDTDAPTDRGTPTFVCPDCGAPMIVIDVIVRGQPIRAPPQIQCAP